MYVVLPILPLCICVFLLLCFQHELLGKSTRRLLKPDTAPTLFEHNKDRLPRREPQLCDDQKVL